MNPFIMTVMILASSTNGYHNWQVSFQEFGSEGSCNTAKVAMLSKMNSYKSTDWLGVRGADAANRVTIECLPKKI